MEKASCFCSRSRVLSLNPLVLDYFSCARGYGLALGFFFYSMYQAIRYLVESRPPRSTLYQAGVALGLAVGCNPIMIFPGLALAACVVAILLGEALMHRPEPVAAGAPTGKKLRKGTRKRPRNEPRELSAIAAGRSWTRALVEFVLVAAAVGGFFLTLPKQLVELERDYMGPASLRAILEGLVAVLAAAFALGVCGPHGPHACRSHDPVRDECRHTCAARDDRGCGRRSRDALAARAHPGSPAAERPGLLLLAATLPATLGLVVLSRYAFQKPYPELRTAMYWIPLLSLASLCLARWLFSASGNLRFAAVPLVVVLVLSVVQYATQFNTRYFAEWAYCAAGKDMVQAIRAGHGTLAGRKVRIGLSWQLEPVVNFYRVAWRLAWMDPVYRDYPGAGYDYYLLMNDDIAMVDRLRLRTLMRDRLSGVVLAKRTEPE